LDAVRIDMDKGFSVAPVKGEYGKGGTRHRFLDTEAACEALHKGRFACSKVAVKGQDGAWRQGDGEPGGAGAGLVGRGGDYAHLEFT